MKELENRSRNHVTFPLTLRSISSLEVFHPNLLASSLPFTPAHMQVLLGSRLSQSNEEIVFLYKLRYGLELTSHAAQCELLCGINPQLVGRAEQIADFSRKHNLDQVALEIADDVAEECVQSKELHSQQNLQKAEGIARAFVRWNLEQDEETSDSHTLSKLASILDG